MKAATFGLGFGALILALMVWVLQTGGLSPVSAEPQLTDVEAAIRLVQECQPVPGNPQTINDRIALVLDRTNAVGVPQHVAGWAARPLGDRKLTVTFTVQENGAWITAEWFVNLQNGWVNPTNQYANWLMFNRSW